MAELNEILDLPGNRRVFDALAVLLRAEQAIAYVDAKKGMRKRCQERMALGLGVTYYGLTSYDSLFFNKYQQAYVYKI
jgi:hypothetical protein